MLSHKSHGKKKGKQGIAPETDLFYTFIQAYKDEVHSEHT